MPEPRVDASTIADALRHDVSEGRLAPGEFVREIALSERFGVSRTPVREALSRLEQERLLERDGRGMRVRVVDLNEVVQVYALREHLEGEAAAQAALARNAGDLLALEGLLARDAALIQPDDDTRRRTNREFHSAVWAAAHNAPLTDLLERLSWHVPQLRVSTLSNDLRWSAALDEHDAILHAIENRDAVTARLVASGHMREAGRIRLQMMRDGAGR